MSYIKKKLFFESTKKSFLFAWTDLGHFYKKNLFANFLQIHGPFWDTFIKKFFLADIQKKL